MEKWESEKYKSWAEGFNGHVATDGSLVVNGGKWEACGWAVVQMDYDDEEMEPPHGMHGSMDAEFSAHLQEGGVDSLFCAFSGMYVDPSRSMWTTRE